MIFIEWIAVLFLMIGIILNAMNFLFYGFCLSLFGCLCWVFIGYRKKMYTIMVLNIVFVLLYLGAIVKNYPW